MVRPQIPYKCLMGFIRRLLVYRDIESVYFWLDLDLLEFLQTPSPPKSFSDSPLRLPNSSSPDPLQ